MLNRKCSTERVYLIVERSVVRIRDLGLLGVRRLRGGQGPRHREDVLQKFVLLTQAFCE